MSFFTDLARKFKAPQTAEQQALESVREKTENYAPKPARLIQSSTSLVYDQQGQVTGVMVIKHGAHA